MDPMGQIHHHGHNYSRIMKKCIQVFSKLVRTFNELEPFPVTYVTWNSLLLLRLGCGRSCKSCARTMLNVSKNCKEPQKRQWWFQPNFVRIKWMKWNEGMKEGMKEWKNVEWRQEGRKEGRNVAWRRKGGRKEGRKEWMNEWMNTDATGGHFAWFLPPKKIFIVWVGFLKWPHINWFTSAVSCWKNGDPQKTGAFIWEKKRFNMFLFNNTSQKIHESLEHEQIR